MPRRGGASAEPQSVGGTAGPHGWSRRSIPLKPRAQSPPGRIRRVLAVLTFAVAPIVLVISAAAQDRREVIAAVSRGQHDLALRLVTELLDGNPRDPALLTLRGIALNQAGRPTEALGAYRRAIGGGTGLFGGSAGRGGNRIPAARPGRTSPVGKGYFHPFREPNCPRHARRSCVRATGLPGSRPALRESQTDLGGEQAGAVAIRTVLVSRGRRAGCSSDLSTAPGSRTSQLGRAIQSRPEPIRGESAQQRSGRRCQSSRSP